MVVQLVFITQRTAEPILSVWSGGNESPTILYGAQYVRSGLSLPSLHCIHNYTIPCAFFKTRVLLLGVLQAYWGYLFTTHSKHHKSNWVFFILHLPTTWQLLMLLHHNPPRYPLLACWTLKRWALIYVLPFLSIYEAQDHIHNKLLPLSQWEWCAPANKLPTGQF